jgi:hypothetical protein
MKVVRVSQDPALEKFMERFDLPSKPGEKVPNLPASLDELSDAALMSSYSEFMAWVSYAKAEMVKAEIDEDRLLNASRMAEATALIGQWSNDAKGDRVTLAKARRDTDPKVMKAQEDYRQARAYRKLVESMFDRCERGSQVLSRELSRRIGLAPREGRHAKWSA